MDGVRLGARFSLATNRLKYCGPADAEPLLYRAVTEGTGLDLAADALARFEALYPYLEAIARHTGSQPFDGPVVEAYWIGNRLLDRFGPSEFHEILTALSERGLPKFVARELAEALPPKPLPHHMFHVAFVGVGAVTGHVETTVPNMQQCRPSWARVLRVEPSRLIVEQSQLVAHGSSVELGPEEERAVAYDPRFLAGIAPGDDVAVHWEWAALKLTAGQRANLERYTRLALDQANAARSSQT